MIKEREKLNDILLREPIEPTIAPRRKQRREIAGLLPAALWFVAALTLYLGTQTHQNTFDAVSYAGLIAIHADAPGSSIGWMFHPHHLLFNAMGYFFWKMALVLGSRASSLAVLQTVNAILGALGIALFYLTVRRILPRDPWLAVLLTLGLATSFGYWICATDGRVNMPSLLFLIAAFDLLVRLIEKPSRALAAALGFAAGLAVLFHESAGLFGMVGLVGAVAVGLAERESARPREIIALPALYLAAFIATVAVPYLAIGYCLLGLHSAASFRHWANSYAELGWWWNFHVASDLHQDVYALRHALFVEPAGAGTIHLAPTVPLWLRAIYWIALAGWVSVGLFVIAALPRLLRSGRRILIISCLLWTALYAAFFTVWSPGYFVFWVPALVPLTVLAALAVHALPCRRQMPAKLALCGWLALCIAINWTCSIHPNMAVGASPFQRVAADLRAHTEPGDLIVVMGAGNDAQCEVDIPYFAERNLLSLHSTLTTAHEDVPLALSRSRAQIAHALGRDRRVYALDDVIGNRGALLALHARHPEFTAADLQSLVGSYRWKVAWVGPRGPVWQLVGPSPNGPPLAPAPAASPRR